MITVWLQDKNLYLVSSNFFTSLIQYTFMKGKRGGLQFGI